MSLLNIPYGRIHNNNCDIIFIKKDSQDNDIILINGNVRCAERKIQNAHHISLYCCVQNVVVVGVFASSVLYSVIITIAMQLVL